MLGAIMTGNSVVIITKEEYEKLKQDSEALKKSSKVKVEGWMAVKPIYGNDIVAMTTCIYRDKKEAERLVDCTSYRVVKVELEVEE